MFIGVTKSNRGTFNLNEDCPNCKEKNTLVATIYHNIFWLGLPWFPVSKTADTYCTKCKKFYNEYELPINILNKLIIVKNSIKAKKWMYLFLIIALFVIPFSLIKECSTRSNNTEKLQTLEVGNIITFEANKNYYYRAKVVSVNGNDIILKESTYEPQKTKNMPLLSEEFFNGDVMEVTVSDLNKMNDNGNINNIKKD